MKKSKLISLVSQTALVAMLAALAGCSSENYQQGQSTAQGLQNSANTMGAGKGKITAALTALNAMTSDPNTDLAGKFAKYNSAVSDLESTGKKVKDHVDAMRKKGDAYFSAWDQQLAQIQNEDIKARSVERKKAVMDEFAGIKKTYAEGQQAFRPFMAQLKDIQTALNTDLTPGGVDSIKDAASKANDEGEKVNEIVDKLIAEFKDLGVKMGAAPLPPPAQPAASGGTQQ